MARKERESAPPNHHGKAKLTSRKDAAVASLRENSFRAFSAYLIFLPLISRPP